MRSALVDLNVEIVTAQKQPESLQINNQNCSWLRLSNRWEHHQATITTNSKLQDRGEIEQ